MPKIASLCASLCLTLLATPFAAAAPANVEMTWMSIANWYFKIGDKRIVMDGYISRVPGPPFFYAPPAYPNDPYAYTQKPYGVDTASIARVREAMLGSAKIDYLLVGRAFLFTVDTTDGPLSFFVQNSASAFDLDKDIVVDGVNHGAPLKNLAAAMADAGLKQVDVWIGTGGQPIAELIVPVIHPKVYIPNHWDGLFNPFWKGMPYPFKDDPLEAYLDAQKVVMMPERQYFDTYAVSTKGVTLLPNHEVKQKLGFADVQGFDKAMLESVTRVASTSEGDDCGEGYTDGTGWARALAYPQGVAGWLPAAPGATPRWQAAAAGKEQGR